MPDVPDVWPMLTWLLLALVVKGALAAFTIFQSRGKSSDVNINYKVVQAPAKADKAQVLVTGGCGLLGRHIVDLLQERFADEFQVHVLDAGAKADPSRPNVTYIQGDVRVMSHVRSALTGKAAVIHCAALMEMAYTDLRLMRAVNVGGTRNVVEACLDLDTRALVFTSSVAVHYRAKAVDMSRVMEGAPLPSAADMIFEYSRTKYEAERLVLGANGHVLRTVALRPGGIHGYGDLFLTDHVPTAAPVLGYLNKHVPYCWVRDAARAHVIALTQLLMPGDHAMHARAAAPWLCPPSAWDDATQTAWGWCLRQDPHYQRVFGSKAKSEESNGSERARASVAAKLNGSSVANGTVPGSVAAKLNGLSMGNGANGTVPGSVAAKLNGSSMRNGANGTAGAVAVVWKNGQGIAGRALHLSYDPDNELPPFRQMNGAGDPEGAPTNAWGWHAKPTIPLWFVSILADINLAIGRRLGVSPIPGFLTPVNIQWVKRDGVFDISNAKALLGWQPVPWRTVVRLMAAEWQARRDMAALGKTKLDQDTESKKAC